MSCWPSTTKDDYDFVQTIIIPKGFADPSMNTIVEIPPSLRKSKVVVARKNLQPLAGPGAKWDGAEEDGHSPNYSLVSISKNKDPSKKNQRVNAGEDSIIQIILDSSANPPSRYEDFEIEIEAEPNRPASSTLKKQASKRGKAQSPASRSSSSGGRRRGTMPDLGRDLDERDEKEKRALYRSLNEYQKARRKFARDVGSLGRRRSSEAVDDLSDEDESYYTANEDSNALDESFYSVRPSRTSSKSRRTSYR